MPPPEEPEGLPTPFNHGKRIPYIAPSTPSPRGNPFAANCGNPFSRVGANPPAPSPTPEPNLGYDVFAPIERHPEKKPEARPGFNPFAARQKGELAIMQRPTGSKGNPFARREATKVEIGGKVMPNPFV